MWSVGVLIAGGEPAPRPHRPVRAGRRALAHVPSQACTLPGLALTHCSAAFSGSMCLPAIRFATKFWSFADHFQRLITPTAGEPDLANFDVITFSMIVCPYAHR